MNNSKPSSYTRKAGVGLKIKHSKLNSFTLIELLVVVGVMGLLMSMAMPQFSDMLKGNRLIQAVNRVDALVSSARGYAISNRKEVRVTITQAGNLFKSEVLTPVWVSDGADSHWRKDAGDWTALEQKSLPTGTTFSSDETFTFRSTGFLDNVSSYIEFDVKEVATGGDSYTVTVNEFSGKSSYVKKQ